MGEVINLADYRAAQKATTDFGFAWAILWITCPWWPILTLYMPPLPNDPSEWKRANYNLDV
jgi:hypothetical protein